MLHSGKVLGLVSKAQFNKCWSPCSALLVLGRGFCWTAAALALCTFAMPQLRPGKVYTFITAVCAACAAVCLPQA
jgi:hypothetical protein